MGWLPVTARTLTAGQLRDLIADVPDRAPVLVETIVGGDLVTADTALVDARVATDSDGHYLRLLPDPADEFGTRALIDHGLDARDVVGELLDEYGDRLEAATIHTWDEGRECVDDCDGCAVVDLVRQLRALHVEEGSST